MRWIDQGAELRLLGSILLRPDVWHLVQADFDPRIFTASDYREIAEIIHELGAQGKKPSATRVMMALRKTNDNASQLIDTVVNAAESVFTTEEAGELMKILTDHWQKRHVQAQLQAATNAIATCDDDTPTEEILAKAQEALVSAFVDRGRQEIMPWMDVLQNLYAEFTEAQAGRAEIAYPFGLVELTRTIGGMRKKRMYLLAGRPSMGKSAVAMNIALHSAKQGRRSLIFTLEQSATEFAQRALSAHLKLPADRWSRYPWADDEKSVLDNGLSKAMKWPINMVDIRRPTVDKVRMLARVAKAQHPDLSLIVLDYFQELRIDVGRGKNMANAIGDVASDLRALADELDVVLIVVSQLNRGVESRDNKRPMMSDLRESGRLEEVADTILLLYRHGYYEPWGDEMDNICEIIVGKNRQGGGAGKTPLAYFDRQFMQLRDLTPQEGAQYSAWYQSAQKPKSGRGGNAF